MKPPPAFGPSFMNLTCKCGHTADMEEFMRTPVGGDLTRQHYQCPICHRAWRLVFQGKRRWQMVRPDHPAAAPRRIDRTTPMKTNDPANYRQMSEPFDSPGQANTALAAFVEAVAALRKEHRIADVTLVMASNVIYASGEEGRFVTHAHLGDAMQALPNIAYAYGREQADHRELLNKFSAGKATHTIPL